MQTTLWILIINVYLLTFSDVFRFTKCIAATPTLPVCRELLCYSCCVYSPRFGVSERLVFKSAVFALSPIVPSELNFGRHCLF